MQLPKRFRLLSFILVIVVVVVAFAITWDYFTRQYRIRFKDAIATADRIVIRDGGFGCCNPVDNHKILFDTSDPKTVALVRNNIVFELGSPASSCACCGYPGIDWYGGKQRLALTAVQHGKAIRWKGFPGDAVLTSESSAWLKRWLSAHGIDPDGESGRISPAE